MSDYEGELGTIRHVDGGYEARLERLLEHDQRSVWAMLTEPQRMVEWLAPGEIELRKGGAAKLNFSDSGIVIDSTVSEFDPPRLLEYSWSGPGEPERPVRWETQPAQGGTRLILTLRVPEDEDVARSCAGWEAHLMMLLAAIEGVPIKFPFERFQATRKAYNEMLGR
ncbi:MAG: SRPBCC family protein [Pseudomonadales bacterium]